MNLISAELSLPDPEVCHCERCSNPVRDRVWHWIDGYVLCLRCTERELRAVQDDMLPTDGEDA